MASLAELQDALVNADKAGDTAAAQQLADAIHGMRSVQDAKPAAAQAGGMINDVGRQVGLTARYGLEGLANTAQLVTEPLRYVTDRLTGQTGKTRPLGAMATQLADSVGLPSPQGANERTVGEATRLMAGAGGMAGGAGALANRAGPVAGKVLSSLSANPMQQVTAAAGSGLAGGASKEAGGGFWQQLGASALGGIAGGMAPSGVSALRDGFNALKREAGGGMTPQQLDAKISLVLQRSGVDYSAVPERVKQTMRSQMQGALEADKEINPQAASRLLDFTRTGTTPTRGMVSQDPVQITREMNLAKIGANSSDTDLHGMARLQNRNNTRLIENLNEGGANRGDLFRAGQANIDNIQGRDASLNRWVNELYTAAKAMPGGETQLQRKGVVDAVFNNLARENKLSYLPADIAETLNTISTGQIRRNGQTFDVPFDAKVLDNLLTDIARAQRGTQDGNIKAALSIARSAIDNVSLTPIKTTYGGNQLVTAQTAQGMRTADGQAGEFMGALNQARAAARQRFGWQESSRPVEAALGNGAPDNFIQRFVVGGTLDDAAAVAANGNAMETKNAIVAHLKDKALSSASDEIGKFSQAAYNKALKSIGDRKLSLFFDAQEIEQLKSVGRAASYMTNQPVGSAVNNSNSGALGVAKMYDALRAGIGMVPGVGPVTAGLLDVTLGNPTKAASGFLAQRQAQNFAPGLLVNQRNPMAERLLLPGAANGGLLAAPSVPSN